MRFLHPFLCAYTDLSISDVRLFKESAEGKGLVGGGERSPRTSGGGGKWEDAGTSASLVVFALPEVS